MRTQLFIDNEWRDAADGKMLDVINPATETLVARVASADPSDVDLAVSAARRALDGPWAKLSARQRGRLVWAIGEQLLREADDIARLETAHNGKPIFESRQIEVPAAAECFQYYAGWARPFRSTATTSPTRCASRSAWWAPSCRGIFRCCSRLGKWRPRSRAATPSC